MPEQDETALRAEVVRLNKMVKALMNRAERAMNAPGSEFGVFQSMVMLERQVQERTRELEAAVQENEKINRDLQRTMQQLEQEKDEQHKLIRKLEETDNQLLQSEKLASIGQLAAGVAHEINNPIGFVNSNLGTLQHYTADLLQLIDAYESVASQIPASRAKELLDELRHRTDLAYLRKDITDLIAESIDGTSRVRQIVLDLRDFSRTGPVDRERADLHAGLDRTINLVWNEIRYKANLVREYGDLPLVDCIPSQINQVFMNLLVNAAHAIREHGTITLRSGRDDGMVWISVSDTGAGIAPEHLSKIFDPFFTTKPVGKGTGLGLSVSYGIVSKHGGSISVDSQQGRGTTFVVRLPIDRPTGS
ncbi:MAG: ATP-binding protein [Azoarcus sp.]|nr:ATP-binding protein [Azoarcus sp.]